VILKSDVKGIIIHGAGRHFSSGADLDDLIKPMATMKKNAARLPVAELKFFLENLKTFIFFDALKIPVVAAIRGVCLGSGLELALSCHARRCGRGSVLGFPEIGFGLLPGCGGIQKINEISGRSRALELILSGSSFSEEEALEWKLVDKIVPKKDVVGSAVRIIKSVENNYNRYGIKNLIHRFL
jgi:enoyl-CoA hydratase/carnithine racemase